MKKVRGTLPLPPHWAPVRAVRHGRPPAPWAWRQGFACSSFSAGLASAMFHPIVMMQSLRRISSCPTSPTAADSSEVHVTLVGPSGDSGDGVMYTEVEALDIFALSRVSNYLTRVTAPQQETQTPASRARQSSSAAKGQSDPFSRLQLEWTDGGLLRATLPLPVCVCEDGQVVHREICATGFGTDQRSARVACCTHAERCLDALGIPLFTSARRQKERAELAQREGRSAPSQLDGAPAELGTATLPPPVRVGGAAQAAKAPTASAKGLVQPKVPADTGGKGGQPTVTAPVYAAVKLTSFQPSAPGKSPDQTQRWTAHAARQNRTSSPRRRRSERHHMRFGPDLFLAQVAREMETLRHVMLQRAGVDDENDDDTGGEMGHGDGPLTIDPHEVSILQPTDEASAPTPRSLPHTSGGAHVLATAGASRPVGYHHPERMVGVRDRESAALVDESEGGVFDLVEGDGETWYWEPREPGPWCLRDPTAVTRLEEYFTMTRQAPFADCVAVSTSSEPTAFLNQERRRFEVREATWYTAAVELPEVGPGYRGMGKATSPAKAADLCAMHTEALLGYQGIPIFPRDAHAQARYYAASLKWGRCVSPSPLPPLRASGGAVPKPLKEWHLRSKVRFRSCPLNTTEKLLALNRRVVGQARQHLLELDFSHDGYYDEVIALAEPCVRAFLLAQCHPFEGAYFNFVYQRDHQYRCSIYLPLPERFGVRGGCAIAGAPTRARQLAALHAVDVLCALNAIPRSCRERDDWQRMLMLRAELGLIEPSASVAHPQMRSPPGYREVSRFASRRLPTPQDVWRIMTLDADVFDVTPPLFNAASSGQPPQVDRVDWQTALTRLFNASMAHLAGWGPDETWRQVHHYCGAQHVQGRRRLAANNYWLVLPVDEVRYGQYVAIGRCITRVGALRQLYIHALRILHALRLTPWDVAPPETLLRQASSHNMREVSELLSLWSVVKQKLLTDPEGADTSADSAGQRRSEAHTAGHVREADIISSTTSSMTTKEPTLPPGFSPHPTMSAELASKTFL